MSGADGMHDYDGLYLSSICRGCGYTRNMSMNRSCRDLRDIHVSAYDAGHWYRIVWQDCHPPDWIGDFFLNIGYRLLEDGTWEDSFRGLFE